jgi:hypothetical protein
LKAGAKRVVVCTPTVRDWRGKILVWEENLLRYSAWIMSKKAEHWDVVDIHGPMRQALDQNRVKNPRFTLAGDGVHPNREGSWLMAREFLTQYLGAKLDGKTSAEQLFPARGDEIRKLVAERSGILRSAWMTKTGHKRPGVVGGPGTKPGPSVEEANKRSAELSKAIAAMIVGQAAPKAHPDYEPAPIQAPATTNLPVGAKISAKGLSGGIVSIDVRCPQTGKVVSSPASAGIQLVGWRGERVNAQVVTCAATLQRQLCVDPVSLECDADQTRKIGGEPHFVRYVLADDKPTADILDTEPMIEQPAGCNRPVWLSVDIPRDAQPGQYSGCLTVRSEIGSIEFPVRLEVLAATLPEPKDWVFHLDIWQHPQAVARWHDVKPWSPEHFALMKPLMKRLADAGQKNITCSIIHEPWGGQTFDTWPSMVEWRKKTDGSWSFDYTIFDRWVDFMMNEIGIKGQIVCYTIVPWRLQFRYYDEASRKCVDLKAEPGTALYDEIWGRFLTDFTAHLKAKGWLAKTAIGMDERPDKLMKPALETLKKYAPDLRVVTAIKEPSALTADLYEISPFIKVGLSERIDQRRRAGKISTFYVCCGPSAPNTFTGSPLAESAWLPLRAVAGGYDGFLRWAYNSWVENPLRSTDYVTWPSGDCFLVYPGNRSSLRWERMRDGIEEAEKIRILRDPGNPETNRKLDEVLKPLSERFTPRSIFEPDLNKVTKAVEALSREIKSK